MIERPEHLVGTTYKISPPIVEESIYVTINNLEVNGVLRPVEIFINSREMRSFQYISLITRLLSAHMREDEAFPIFLLQELADTYQPGGGYFIPKTRHWAHSIVAHIGWILQRHCEDLGLIPKEEDAEEK